MLNVIDHADRKLQFDIALLDVRSRRRHTANASGPQPRRTGSRSVPPPRRRRRRRRRHRHRRLTATAVAVQQVLEGASKIRIEDMIDDRVQHGAAVGEPLEGGEQLRRDVRLALGAAGALDDVDGEERQVADDEDREEDAENLDGATALVRRRRSAPAAAATARRRDAATEREAAVIAERTAPTASGLVRRRCAGRMVRRRAARTGQVAGRRAELEQLRVKVVQRCLAAGVRRRCQRAGNAPFPGGVRDDQVPSTAAPAAAADAATAADAARRRRCGNHRFTVDARTVHLLRRRNVRAGARFALKPSRLTAATSAAAAAAAAAAASTAGRFWL